MTNVATKSWQEIKRDVMSRFGLSGREADFVMRYARKYRRGGSERFVANGMMQGMLSLVGADKATDLAVACDDALGQLIAHNVR